MIPALRVQTTQPRACFLISSVEPNLVTVEAMRFLFPHELKKAAHHRVSDNG